MILCANEIAYLAVQGWGTTTQPDGTPNALLAVAICYGESGGDFSAIGQNVVSDKPSSGSQDLGGWQINNYWHREKLLRTPAWRDPWVALSLAVQVFHEAGQSWKPWHAFTGGGYQKHLPKATIALLQPWAPPGGTLTASQKTALGLSPASPTGQTDDV